MLYRVVPIGPDGISDSRWQEYYELLLELKRRYRSTCRSASWDDHKQRMLSHMADDKHFHPALVYEKDRLVGWADFTARNIGTPNQVLWQVYDVLPHSIPDGMIRALARWTVEHMCQYGADTLYHMAWDARYWDIDEHWGGKQFSRSQEYVLHRSSADQVTIAELVAAISRNNPNLSMTFHEEIPDNLIDSCVQLLIEGFRDIPEESDSGMSFHTDRQEIRRVERWCQANGVLSLNCLLHDEKNHLIGLSESRTNLKQPGSVDQLMTTVRKSHRGRGLARWLKCAMFLELTRRLHDFERIVTWMRAINEPILHINAQLGFVPEREAREFKISRASIERYLDQNS